VGRGVGGEYSSKWEGNGPSPCPPFVQASSCGVSVDVPPPFSSVM